MLLGIYLKFNKGSYILNKLNIEENNKIEIIVSIIWEASTRRTESSWRVSPVPPGTPGFSQQAQSCISGRGWHNWAFCCPHIDDIAWHFIIMSLVSFTFINIYIYLKPFSQLSRYRPLPFISYTFPYY